MAVSVFDKWCELEGRDVGARRRLHVLRERDGGRSSVESQIDETVVSHYEDPRVLSERIARAGLPRAAALLRDILPRSKKARSGHLGEIFATEAAPSVLTTFYIPIKRLRWLDGREAALRGEDLIGIEQKNRSVRFLKGESKSRSKLTPAVVAEAREMLLANDGRPSQHALSFIMHRLFELGQDELAIVFEEFMLLKPIPAQQIVHLLFTLSGNDAAAALEKDLQECPTEIEQHAISLHIADHQKFIAGIYDRVSEYGSHT
jgi:hypothetical protein